MKQSSIIFSLMTVFVLGCSDKKDLEGGGNFDQQILFYSLKDGKKTLASSNNLVTLNVTKAAENTTQSLNYIAGFAKENKTNSYNLSISSDAQAVNNYNQINGTNYQLFPDSLVTFTNSLSIENGSVSSSQGNIDIKIAEQLENNVPYLFALKVQSANNFNVLPGAEVLYFLIQKTVPVVDKSLALTRERYLKIENTGSQIGNIGGTFTMEGLVFIEKFRSSTDVGEAQISSFMGTEGGTLMRFGDAGISGNQLQINGRMIGSFEEKKWYHIATVVDGNKTKVYVNGELMADYNAIGALGEFYVGRSFSDGRGIWGRVAELRVWNVARTAEEIKDNIMGVGTNEPGLYAYWKMSEIVDNKIPDASGNNRDLSLWAQGADQSRKDIKLFTESSSVTIP